MLATTMRHAIGILLPLALVPSIASAHGDYDWINKGAYRNEKGEQCCGKDDCYELKADQVQESAVGYVLTDLGVTIRYRDRIVSEDGKYWVCRSMTRVRCFFAPLSGF